jgi:type 1 glutamine amidotransferase
MKRHIIVAAIFALSLSAGAQTPPPATAPPTPPAPAAPKQKPLPAPKDNSKLPVIAGVNLAKLEAALPAKATAPPRKPRKVLVFWRCEQFFHAGGIAGGNKAIELMGTKTGAYTADFSRDYASLEGVNLAKYDALVFNNTTHLDTFPWGLSETQKQAILAFARGGKGIVGIHAATDNFYKWPDGQKLLGAAFFGHPWAGGGTWAFKLDEPTHPLAKAFGGNGFKLKDEIYQFKEPYSRANCRVLLSIDLADAATDAGGKRKARKDNDYAVAWIKKEGEGRVFYCSLGHDMNVFQEPDILKFYLDGIQYALGDLAADATPKQ